MNKVAQKKNITWNIKDDSPKNRWHLLGLLDRHGFIHRNPLCKKCWGNGFSITETHELLICTNTE